MGTDIHAVFEVRNPAGVWEAVGEPDETRNYRLFAALAGVRNGVGFAGVDTGDAVAPVFPPRGLPDCASPEYLDRVADMGEDGHSHSWLTLAELLAYDWTQPVVTRGLVPLDVYANWCGFAEGLGWAPNDWSAGVSGPGIQHVSRDEAGVLIAGGTRDEAKRVYVRCQWTQPFCVASGGAEWSRLIAPMLRKGAPESVRVVFFFDN